MNDLKKNIIEELKKIKYPEFNRDIISFGILKDIVIDENNIKVLLNLKTNNDNHKKIIQEDIIDLLNKSYDFLNITVDFIKELEESSNNSLDSVKNIIAIGSCKGGVGKSTVALNLACQLSKKYKVGLLDLDIYGPSLPTMIKNYEQPELIDNKLIPFKKYGMEFMSFGFINNDNKSTIWRGPMVARMTQQFFDNVNWGELDFLFIDLPPGTGDIQLTLVQKIALSGAIIVTTPQDLSLIDVEKGSDMFRKVNVPILGVVENMSNYCVKGKISGIDNYTNIKLLLENEKIDIDSNGDFEISFNIFSGLGGAKESNRLNVPLLGKLNIDSHLSSCSDSGTPYVLEDLDTYNSKEFYNISKKIID
tara:strand:- start:16925 stop:18013 length:1089 start_codon:yes stop_codon:yes gene_type:complete